MKKVITIYLSLLASSCSILDSGNIAPGYKEAFVTINSALFGEKKNDNINRDLIDNIPYASMLLRIGNGPEGLMILESISGKKETWVSQDGIRIVVEDGRIISTRGLINNLKSITLPKMADFSDVHLYTTNHTFYSYYSFSNPILIDLKTEHNLNKIGLEEIYILETLKKLELIEENVKNSKIRWFFTNKYWIDESDYVWKSEQEISPKLPVIYFQVTKKPSL